MKTHKLLAEHRANLRDLVQGYIEHCAISTHLVGSMEHSVYFQGRKYGFPVFTVHGPELADRPPVRVNVLGVNPDGSKVLAETVLQLIERWAVQPEVASGHLLRVMPVSNPLALELGAVNLPQEAALQLQGHVDAFRGEPSDGLIEVTLTDQADLRIFGRGPTSALGAMDHAAEVLQRLLNEEFSDGLAVALVGNQGRGPWRLTVGVPRHWPASTAVRWTSQFLVVFFRSLVAQADRSRSSAAVFTTFP